MSNKSKIFGQQKILSHLDKVRSWLDGKDNTLITAEIDMTNNCNSNCPYCIGGRVNQASLTLKEAQSYISQLKQLGVGGLIFTGGGEPTLNPAIPEAVKYAHKAGLDVGFITNGIVITDEMTKVLLKNCVWCRISLDAGTQEMYQRTHGQGKEFFEKVLENTKKLVMMKKKLGSNCTVGVGYLTGKDTIKGMEDFVRLVSKLGVDYAQFRPFHWDFSSIDKEFENCKKYETNNFKVVYSAQKYAHFKVSS